MRRRRRRAAGLTPAAFFAALAAAAVTAGTPPAARAQGAAPQHAPKPAPAPPLAPAAPGTKYPEPGPPRDPDALGRGVQRTMTLLATSTPRHRNRVRILFYGQSITEQDWTRQVAADLRRRFPFADLEIENRAIGGFASQFLIRPAEHDLYPFYPDLMIFHVYGADSAYEDIIRNTRGRTAAEVLMQKDHATFWPPAHVSESEDKGKWWDDHMNNVFLPATAKKYGCGLDDVRTGWLDYCRANHLDPPQLTVDGTHLNDQGNFLMARLIERYLVYRPDLPKADWQDLARTYAVGKDAAWKAGRLEIAFDGNRVDLLPAAGAHGPVRVLIDDRAPSTFPGAYAITRPRPNPWAGPVSLSRVDHAAPLVPEDWTLKVTSVGPDSKSWAYVVTGSVTGPDGAGDSTRPFTSRSGRVKIDPQDFFRGFARDPVPVGHAITWRVVPLFADTYAPPNDSDPTRDRAATVVQGIPNGRHTLTLIADAPDGPPPVRAVRVYRPPVAAAAP